MSDKATPLISVIIAIYNPGKYLSPCLDSIINQTYKNLEIILVDDGSTDNSLEVCKEYAEKDSRIIVHHKENSGVSATRNKGIDLAHGDYYSFIDSDDILEADTYEYLINIINEHQVDAVNYEHYITYNDRETVHKLPDNRYGLFDRVGAVAQLTNGVLFAWNKLFSKKIIEGVRFHEKVCRGEDSLFAIQAFDKAEKVWFDSRPLYHYVQSEESAVRGRFRPSQLTGIHLIDIYDSFFTERFPENPELYNNIMSFMLNLMTLLYVDMSMDEGDYKKEMKTVVEKFKGIYPKVDLNCIPKKRRIFFRLFKFSPVLYSWVKRVTSRF